ncbi:MAG TPA: tetratricopeptide repeat protein, partial [Blastocatellia bacterium]|nr:tetratricopeptide repeat protein [Blastocatellia bacterium]
MRVLFSAAVLVVVLATGGAAYAQGDADWDSGVSHFKQQQFRQAISDFQKVADAHPDFANTYYYMGLSHFRLKEYGKSIVALVRYIDLAEKNGGKADAAARAVLGRAYFLTDDNQKAVTTLTVATQTVTDDPVNFYYLGVAYQRLNQNDKALENFDRALKLNPKDPFTLDQSTRLLLSRAIASGSAADWQAAITRAEQLRLVRDDAATATLLGSAYLGAGDFQKASVHLAKVVEANPQDANGWFNYGLSLSRSKQFPQAETALIKAPTLDPKNADPFAEPG